MIAKLGRLIPLLFLLGCYGPKKAERQLEKAYEKQPAIFAKKTNELFPIRTDSVKYIEWKIRTDSILMTITDTITDSLIVNCEQVREVVRNNYKVITRLKEQIRTIPPIIRTDSAAIYRLIDAIKKADKSKEHYKKKSEIFFWILVVLTGLAVIFLLRRR